jgi:hypothetical protein
VAASSALPLAAAGAGSGAIGGVLQLGAYGNENQAEAAWRTLSSRFPAVAGLQKMLTPYQSGGRRGVRLRAGAASVGAAEQVCRQLQAVDQNCFVVR